MSKPDKKLILISFVLLFLTSINVHAEDLFCEIININQDQRIVFVDLGKDSLASGDVMSVSGADHPIYLEVIEASDAISKLKISHKEKFRSKNADLENLVVGMKLTRVSRDGNKEPTIDQPTPTSSTASSILPVLDPQSFVKPDITKESIQSLDDRLAKMADSNVKLLNALAQCQSTQGDSQKTNAVNENLRKQIEEANAKLASVYSEREKYKKQSEDLTFKINDLKGRLDRLDSLIGDQK